MSEPFKLVFEVRQHEDGFVVIALDEETHNWYTARCDDITNGLEKVLNAMMREFNPDGTTLRRICKIYRDMLREKYGVEIELSAAIKVSLNDSEPAPDRQDLN